MNQPVELAQSEIQHSSTVHGSKHIPHKLIGNYIYFLNQELGHGTFAQVYRGALKDDWTKTFAIKVVNIRAAVKQFHGDKERMEKYMEYERGILGNLTHENIVKLV